MDRGGPQAEHRPRALRRQEIEAEADTDPPEQNHPSSAGSLLAENGNSRNAGRRQNGRASGDARKKNKRKKKKKAEEQAARAEAAPPAPAMVRSYRPKDPAANVFQEGQARTVTFAAAFPPKAAPARKGSGKKGKGRKGKKGRK